MRKIIQLSVAFILFMSLNSLSFGQNMKTAYFLDNSIPRLSMNPAFQPERGYFNIPFLGGFNMNFNTNSLTISDIFYPKNGKLVLFTDPSVSANEFLSKLKQDNKIDAQASMNILGFGRFGRDGKSYITFDVTTKTNVGFGLPKDLFVFMKTGAEKINFKNFNITSTAYCEFALGYSRVINDKLTVGIKPKFLAGIMDVQMKIENMDILLSEDKWSIESSGYLEASADGLTAKTKEMEGSPDLYFSGFNLNPRGFGGYGFGMDFGAEYQLLDNLKISAAVIDLGFISWSAKNTIRANSDTNYEFSGFIGEGDLDEQLGAFEDFTKFKMGTASKRNSKLQTTVNVGAEYSFLNDMLSAGILYSFQKRDYNNFNELTLSGNLKLNEWFSASLSYSMIHSQFKTFGGAINFSPRLISIFIGTDYILGKVSKQFIPINQKVANIYFGVSIPMAKRAV